MGQHRLGQRLWVNIGWVRDYGSTLANVGGVRVCWSMVIVGGGKSLMVNVDGDLVCPSLSGA